MGLDGHELAGIEAEPREIENSCFVAHILL